MRFFGNSWPVLGEFELLVLLALLLTMNAFAIWLRNRYQRRW